MKHMEGKEIQQGFLFYSTPNNDKIRININAQQETVWLTQKQMSAIFCVKVPAISKHLGNIFKEGELEERSVVSKMEITATDGKKYQSLHYNLDAIISVGYRVDSYAATQFRIWATSVLREYMLKGFTLDNERLKQGNNLFGKDYFDELLEQIREIRASERRFYQKLTDLYALSADYDGKSPLTREFFSHVQNKLHWAINEQTAAELIFNNADSSAPNMGLITWKNAPDGKILKSDTQIAKNYLTQEKMKELGQLVSAYLELAETRARRGIVTNMADWIDVLEGFLKLSAYPVLTENISKVDSETARIKAGEEYDKFRIQQDQEYISDFDKAVEHIRQHGELPKKERVALERKISNFDSKLKAALSFNPKVQTASS